MTPASAAAPSAQLQLVTFRLGEEEYAVDVAHTQEIVRLTTITAVPRSPRFVEGVVNLRGRIVPVIDLARRFGLPERPRTLSSRIIITQIEGRTVGMLVDAVTEVLRLETSAIEPAPEALGQEVPDAHIMGIGKLEGRLIILLDLIQVLAGEPLAS